MENEKQKKISDDLISKMNAFKINALLVIIFSILSAINYAANNFLTVKLILIFFSAVLFLLVQFKINLKLIDFYNHVLLLVTAGAVSYILVIETDINNYYFFSISLTVFLLIISLTFNWHYIHQLLSAVYVIVIISIAAKINPDYYNFLIKHFTESIVYGSLLIISVIISIINFYIKRNSKNLIKATEENSNEKIEKPNFYQDIFENLAEGLFRSTIDGKIVLANPSFAKILGYNNVEELYPLEISKDLYVLAEEREKLLKILYAQKRVKNYRIKLKKKDNSEIIVKVNERLITDENEKPILIEGSIQDITQQVLAEEEKLQQLEEMRNEKIKAIKDVNTAVYTTNVKAQFLASMSHEIKTPINSIIGFLTLIEKKMFDSEEELQEFAQNAKTAADSLLDIINNVLDISKMEAGKMELDEVEFNFRDEIQKAVAIISPQVSKKNLALSVEIDDQIPTQIVGDPVRFRQVVLNILSNSVKYTDVGEIILKVSVVKFTQATIKIKTSIIDTGRGIPKDKLPLIFKPYTQVKQKKWTEKDGSGLGLMISKQLVELMDGEIQIVSEEGIGTTVEFSAVLKLQKQFKPNITIDESERISDEKKTESISAEETVNAEQKISDELIPVQKSDPTVQLKKKSGKRILLVEDNPISQKVEKKLLSDIGYDVEAVSSALDAIEAIKTNVFDLVLMDIEMPDMDGLTATQKIRGLEAPMSKIPIIAVTAHSSMKDREKCLAAGMDDYIAKPININFMKIIIDQWLNK